ncbi:putative transcription factor interactor and regulator CCHC(Zn) family [Rosa chinensis]|uniref:RBR-type E3 ubiquitin transferase n=1 Tax=Rosa chinensis TaxID=74649 RepID=A0A2P6PZ44_ROSCH|nr:probable E3 ubiquitin-protein ligase ARI7 [Rosa chinensis]XP_024166620.1 probable E3 ubiquitin-protein ligase ARI7 [Rosa chinensis]XP_024166621.1 probable E3 ubiquitin-protein ligase ARI7 [Rosa chinensis]XP_040363620.1 probable E3 ubiquitin-protein ligase ARI7 [Rosa chinensis]PRQ27176.1 putative transcription factor interactor and regulator CCHC(Zn) family [Rosa chinensis]
MKRESSSGSSASEDSSYLKEEVNVDSDDDSNYLEGGNSDANVFSGEGQSPRQGYTLLREEEIGQLQEDDIVGVSTVLSISKSAACFLLCHFSWRVNRLKDEWFSDEDKVRETAGLLRKPVFLHRLGSVNCGICFDDYDYSCDELAGGTIFSAACGHPFCKDCWTGYISTSINDGPGCLMLRCPEPSCTAAVDLDLIRNVLKNQHDHEIERYKRYLLRSYVEKHKQMKWCPAPDCEYAVKVFDEDLTGNGSCYDVSCSCSNSFCWNCVEEVHSPVQCDTVGKWILKNKDDSQNAQWIVVNTKPCPKCKTPIEKNNGCNHMRCSPPCGHHFCWLCLGPLGCKCNSFNRAANQNAKKEESQSERERKRLKMSLERYNHYYVRWANNQASKKKAVESLHKAQTVYIVKLASKPIPFLTKTNDFEFIIEAWKQIIECRQVIKWTYAYGYYIPEETKYDKKRQLFEYLQGQAEHSLERLHQCAETEVIGFVKDWAPLEKFPDFRLKLIQLTNVTGTYFKKLVTALENGLSEVETS